MLLTVHPAVRVCTRRATSRGEPPSSRSSAMRRNTSFPVRHASGLRRSDHHRDLAKQLNARRDAVLQPPEKVFLMRFGQFAGNAKFPWAEHGMGNRERFAQSVLTFKEDKRQCQIGKGRQRLFLIRAAAGKEPQKRERLRRDAAPASAVTAHSAPEPPIRESPPRGRPGPAGSRGQPPTAARRRK